MSIDFSDIQGNILKGFDKPFARFIFFHFNETEAAIIWLQGLARRHTLASTRKLIRAYDELKKKRTNDPSYSPQEVWIHVSLSFQGIWKIGLARPYSHGLYTREGNQTKVTQPPDPKTWNATFDPFYIGMKNPIHATKLGDTYGNDPKNWIEPFKSGTYGELDNSAITIQDVNPAQIHALVIVASDNQDDGDSYSMKLISEATNSGVTCLGLHIGNAIKNEQGKQVEHFGFRDGLSQPLISGIDDKEIRKRTLYSNALPPEEFVLYGLKDALRWANNGSFLVFRRLRQDVSRFWKFMNENSQVVDMKPEELAAKIVGRWKSGAPLAKYRSEPTDPVVADDNDYLYIHNKGLRPKHRRIQYDDKYGWSTPKFAHTRISNPKDEIDDSEHHRILRRGMPYGPSWAEDPDAERGLLFVCYQRDLYEQFVHLQTLFSQDVGNYSPPKPEQPEPHDEIKKLFLDLDQKIGLRNWVTMTGGEYFFSPSISALRTLRARLMVLDKDTEFLATIENGLHTYGFRVFTYSDPTEALLQFGDNMYELILIDVKMAPIDAFEIYGRIDKVDRQAKICFTTPPDYDTDSFKKNLHKKYPNSRDRVFFIKKPLIPNDALRDKIVQEMAGLSD